MKKFYLLMILFVLSISSCTVNNMAPSTYGTSYISTGISFNEFYKIRNEKFESDFKNKKENGNYVKSIHIDTSMQKNNLNFTTKSSFIRKKLFLPGDTPTQRSHESINDKNIFDLSKSLIDSGLDPYYLPPEKLTCLNKQK